MIPEIGNTKNRDQRLATSGNPNKRVNKKSEMLSKDVNDPKAIHSVGRKGYAEKAKLTGNYLRVCMCIREYRQKNPNSSYMDMYRVLHDKFPFIFTEAPEKTYPGNVSKFINNDVEWCNAYFTGSEDLIKMAEYRISKILADECTEDGTVIRAYDTLMKYKVQHPETDDTDNEVEFIIKD